MTLTARIDYVLKLIEAHWDPVHPDDGDAWYAARHELTQLRDELARLEQQRKAGTG